jgi:hypothetical protein
MQTRRSILSALATLPFWGLAARGLSMEEEPGIKVKWWEQEGCAVRYRNTENFSDHVSNQMRASDLYHYSGTETGPIELQFRCQERPA